MLYVKMPTLSHTVLSAVFLTHHNIFHRSVHCFCNFSFALILAKVPPQKFSLCLLDYHNFSCLYFFLDHYCDNLSMVQCIDYGNLQWIYRCSVQNRNRNLDLLCRLRIWYWNWPNLAHVNFYGNFCYLKWNKIKIVNLFCRKLKIENWMKLKIGQNWILDKIKNWPKKWTTGTT